jgi:hypothetical protein
MNVAGKTESQAGFEFAGIHKMHNLLEIIVAAESLSFGGHVWIA